MEIISTEPGYQHLEFEYIYSQNPRVMATKISDILRNRHKYRYLAGSHITKATKNYFEVF
jgi:hypothetical protein